MGSSPARPLSRLVAYLTVAVFVGAVCIPAGANLLRYNPPVPFQESEPNPMPAFKPDLGTIGQVIYTLRRNWLDRNFGLRKVLVRWEQLLDVRILKASMPSDPVLAGNDEWLYLAQENPQLNVIYDYRVIKPLTRKELDIWAKVFSARRDWLAKHGIKYMVLVAPNKPNVYPDHIPARFNKAQDFNKLDQMCQTLRDAGVDVVDLRPSLLEARKHGLAYYRTDSHWTPFGAFNAYRQTVEHLSSLFPDMVPSDISEYTISEKPGLLGGLSYMIAMGDIYPENVMLITPKIPREFHQIHGKEAELNHFQPLAIYENPNKTLPKAFFFRDSFVHEMIPFLGQHFSRMYFQWPFPTDAVHVRDFDTQAILREKPDIVVDQFVERYFTQPPPPSALETLPE